MHPMVYQLPSSFSYLPPALTSPVISMLTPIRLPPVSSFSPDVDRPLNSAIYLQPPTGEKMMEQLPSMSVNAPSWWPVENKPIYQGRAYVKT